MRGPPADRSPRERLEFGVVNLDKPPGPSAHEVASWVRDLAGEALADHETNASNGSVADGDPVDRAAHGGTLDPKVTGVLPILLGDATRLAQVFLEGSKEYVAVLELHASAPDDLDAVLASFEGGIHQKPPKKSAVARRLRVRHIHALDALEIEERRVLLDIHCESGTYIRKLCHDLGLALGTGAHMGGLRRVATTPFTDADLVSLHDLADALAVFRDATPTRDSPTESDALAGIVEPAERALVHLPRVTIAENAAREVAEGAPVYAPGVRSTDGVATVATDDPPLVACYTPDGAVVCLGRLVGDPDATAGTVVDLERVLV